MKNNLQIVMSLLSIQANQVKDLGAREALLQAQTRINALALVHRILNELEDQSTLDIRQLLDELSHQIAGGMSNDKVRVEVDVPSRVVSGQRGGGAGFVHRRGADQYLQACLSRQARRRHPRDHAAAGGWQAQASAIADNGMGFAMDDTRKSVGSRLIKTFGLQLGGVSRCPFRAGPGTVVDLVFPDPDLRDADELQS